MPPPALPFFSGQSVTAREEPTGAVLYAKQTDKPMSEPMQHPPTIVLQGARLRPVRRDDVAAIHAYLRDPRVTESTSFPEVSESFVETMVQRIQSRWAAGELSKWGIALEDSDRIVGLCGFNEWSKVHRWAELAYDLAYESWGRGLMRQAVEAVLQWTYEQTDVDRVHAFVRVDNRRSQALLERCGFVREGCLRSYRICRGKPYDFNVYSLLRSDWSGPP